MFDIGFSELFLVAVVALLVLGPERLPKAARFAGLWVRRARAQWYSVKSELENELADEELRRNLRATQDELRNAREQLRESGEAMRRDVESGIDAGQPGPDEPRTPPDSRHHDRS
ncbi:Sec-independent protein translocase protein TatB [Lysobacter sp. F6437]|uniref:Sec-independent protein translocase protein TatB n=1 Tax=Lysobacter sp. F6437 TaxID=3459296 RepID=UPI00403D68D1